MPIRQSGGPTKCTLCLRTKEEAISQQKEMHMSCGHPDCPFITEIENALREPPFTIKKRIKEDCPHMRISKRNDD